MSVSRTSVRPTGRSPCTARRSFRESEAWLATETPRHYLGLVGAIGFERTAREAIEGTGGDVMIVVRPERYFSSDYAPETPWFGRLWLLAKRVLPPWL